MNKFLLVFLFCMISPVCFAQAKGCIYPDPIPFCIFPKVRTFSKIAGRVSDSQGAYVPDVCVVLFSKKKKRIASAMTNQKGRFSIKGVPDGRYLLIIQYSFFAPAIAPVRINSVSGKPGFLKVSMVASGIDTCSAVKN